MNQIAHDTLLFNLHDLILLMAVGQYVLLAVLLFCTRKQTEKSSYLLCAFLLLNGAQSVDTLIIWSDQLRLLTLNWHPSLFFWGHIGVWLQGPLLYLYVASVLYKDFRFKPTDALHLLPAITVTGLLINAYYSLPKAEQIQGMQNLQFMWTPLMGNLTTLRYLSVVAYGAWCLFALARYRKQLRHQYANLEVSERSWLTWVVLGVVLIASWALVVHLIGNNIEHTLSNFMGIGGNYFSFIFVNSLVFTSIRYTHLFDGLSSTQPVSAEEPTAEEKGFKDEHILRIQNYMQQHKPYLDNNINLEHLAQKVSLPERTLSRIVNQHFNKNFFEFINTYRIDEAKKLLKQDKTKAIIDVLAEAGFSSKSTFNSIFKQQVGMTPSQYRKLE
ncbi:AraC family transcriptional regulator [Saccharophagus degradans]|uniref:Helix-turn-helix domain-containing protein n=1 Tax=Saccharophagus degradans TaxID=86304 RepID=A0AAW7XB54_9GAMM|nr:helix-turn-helix domain-containing protein [Saccharophagus degradans]MDO6424784.1 helix-turn-helix domain-containing protein [Saccharophagus degradans]MDO6609668.1 helix-turn-helix domain-containing protein [Saccharophagus degradans]